MVLNCITVGDLAVNCYIFGEEAGSYGEKSGGVVVIDPGDECKKIIEYVKSNGLIVKGIVLTHGHFDHIGSVAELKKAANAKVMIHELDAGHLMDSSRNLSKFMGIDETQITADVRLKNGDVVEAGKHKLKVLHTPGHTEGSICLLYEDILFSGDTLFRSSIGRTDFPGGDHGELIHSLNDVLMKLDDRVRVYPGHGPSTSIGYERAYNPYVEG